MKNIYLLILTSLIAFNSFGKKYKGAEIRTTESFLYGRFEVRMKSAAGSGMLSSFFTFYDSPDFAQNWNEIDLEILGRYKNEAQYNAIVGNHQMHEHREVISFNPHESFHVYSFDWTPDYIAWAVDGKEVYRQTGEHVAKMNQPQKIMMNIWPSQFWEWTGLWNDSILPVYAYYDYVNYYNYNPKGVDTFKLSWTDNFNDMDASRWQTATHTFNGNSCDFDPSNVVFKEGYLILCLTKEDYTGYNDSPIVDPEIILSAVTAPENSVVVTFSKQMDPLLVKKNHFKVEGAILKKIKFNPDKRSATLVFDQSVDGKTLQYLKGKKQDTVISSKL